MTNNLRILNPVLWEAVYVASLTGSATRVVDSGRKPEDLAEAAAQVANAAVRVWKVLEEGG